MLSSHVPFRYAAMRPYDIYYYCQGVRHTTTVRPMRPYDIYYYYKDARHTTTVRP